VLCNDPFRICETTVGPPFSLSDHNIVEFLIFCDIPINACKTNVSASTKLPSHTRVKNSTKTRVALWNKANWSEFEFFLQNIAWESYFENSTDSESYWQAFSNILTFGIAKFVLNKI